MRAPPVEKTFAVILAGGQSARLFPFNKVVSDLTGSGRSLIQQAFDRTIPLIPRDHIYVLTTPGIVAPIRRQLRLPSGHCFVDPARRGTWPAILWAMAHLRRRDPGAVMAILTGDHVIPDGGSFRKALQQAVAAARQEAVIVLLGISPSRRPEAWRGFGSFRTDGGRTGAVRPVIAFEEKPSLERAVRMIRQGGWQWNSGMFFFRISTAEAALRHTQPEMWEIYESLAGAVARGRAAHAARLYEKFPATLPHPLDPRRDVDNTIDYAVITPLVHSPFAGAQAFGLNGALSRWADLGEWTALRSLVKADARGNTRLGRIRIGRGTKKCILAADRGCSINASGIEGCVAAISPAGALVIGENDLGRVKELVKARRGRLVAHGVSHLHIQHRGRHLLVRAR